MKKHAILTLNLFLIVIPSIAQWEYHVIDSLPLYSSTVTTGDIDNDGDNDLLVAAWENIILYLNNDLTWTKITIDNIQSDYNISVDMADFNKDGYMDIVATNEFAGLLLWYKNDGGDLSKWVKDTIDMFGTGWVTWAEDFDNDGDEDISFSTPDGQYWYENDLPAGWVKHLIGLKPCGDFDIADINKDGKPDIIGSDWSNSVIFYKNNLPDTNWTEIIIDPEIGLVVCAGDIDNDGDMDVAGAGGTDVVWYENDGSESTWTKHSISTDMVNLRFVDIADSDKDGLPDLVVSDPVANNIILFKNTDGGQNWLEIIVDNNYKTPNAVWFNDVDLDGDYDITPSERQANILVWYENHSPGTVYPETMEVYPFLVQPSADTVYVKASISNPEYHSFSAYAVIQGKQFSYADTLQLYDDGLHHDGDASDNLLGNVKLELPEDSYTIDLFTYDSVFDIHFDYHPSALLIKYGPVELESYNFDESDGITNPGDSLKLFITLSNNGTTAIAEDIKIKIIALDEFITITGTTHFLDDISAGESTTTEKSAIIAISEDCPTNREIPVQVNIFSYDTICWIDTINLQVEDRVNLEQTQEPQFNIYPNPATELLFVEFKNTHTHKAIVKLIDISGKIVYSQNIDRIEQSTHIINLATLKEGVYFIKISSESYSFLDKVVVIK